MYKILTLYFSFVAACVLVILAFITATTYTQLTIAILLYPILVWFAFKVLPLKYWKKISDKHAAEIPIKLEEKESPKRESIRISDIDKRVFLKMIGGAGVFLFLFSILNKRSEGLFFKNVPGQFGGKVALEDVAGNKINPAEKQPLDGYNIAEIDEETTIAFFGFTNKDGAWVVMKQDADTGSFRYSRGEANFPAGWANRENLNYEYFSEVF